MVAFALGASSGYLIGDSNDRVITVQQNKQQQTEVIEISGTSEVGAYFHYLKNNFNPFD